MKQKLSAQTTTFIFLIAACLLGGLLVVVVSGQMLRSSLQLPEKNLETTGAKPSKQNNLVPVAQAAEELVLPNTSAWAAYSNKNLGISFKHPADWKILNPKKQGEYTVLEIDPGKKFYNVKIYASEKAYYIMDGLPASTMQINGQTALNVSNLLFGFNHSGKYFTFDVGRSLSLKNQFNGLVRSVKFSE